MHKELLKVVQDLKFLLAPKGVKRGINTNLSTPPLDQKNRSSPPGENKSSTSAMPPVEPTILPIKIKPLETPADKKATDKSPAKSIGPALSDLVDWYQKKFKTLALSPLSDKRAGDAKKRFEEGTAGASIVVFFPKKGQKELQLYKNIQLAIHNYLLDCQALYYDQFSPELAKKTRLILTDPSWIKPYQKQIILDPATKMDCLWGAPIFYFEAYEKLKTPEGKKRLWQALLSLPRS